MGNNEDRKKMILFFLILRQEDMIHSNFKSFFFLSFPNGLTRPKVIIHLSIDMLNGVCTFLGFVFFLLKDA